MSWYMDLQINGILEPFIQIENKTILAAIIRKKHHILIFAVCSGQSFMKKNQCLLQSATEGHSLIKRPGVIGRFHPIKLCPGIFWIITGYNLQYTLGICLV